MKIAVLHASVDAARAIEVTVRRSRHTFEWSESQLSEIFERDRAPWPDLVIVDAAMRNPSCAEATRRLLASGARAVLLTTLGEASGSVAYDAMASGAVDVVRCPELDDRGDLVHHDALLVKLRTIARLLGDISHTVTDAERIAATATSHKRTGPTLVAIGSSTGGPQALHQILTALPSDLDASFVIVQHVDSTLVGELASWLQTATRMRVGLAASGLTPEPGRVVIAGDNQHLVMTRAGILRYVAEPRDLTHKPSIDVLFTSLASYWPQVGIAALLTGMGRDGAQGLRKLRASGWRTIAQDESTSIVYGMPKAAAELGAAEQVLALADIAPAIARACHERKRLERVS